MIESDRERGEIVGNLMENERDRERKGAIGLDFLSFPLSFSSFLSVCVSVSVPFVF